MNMNPVRILSEDSLEAVKRDHERLRNEINSLRILLRAFRCELGDESSNSVATTDTIIPARSGNTPGGPIMVQRKRINATPEFVDYGPEVPCYSWVKSDSSDPAEEVGDVLWIFIEKDDHGTWWFTGQDCPPE